MYLTGAAKLSPRTRKRPIVRREEGTYVHNCTVKGLDVSQYSRVAREVVKEPLPKGVERPDPGL